MDLLTTLANVAFSQPAQAKGTPLPEFFVTAVLYTLSIGVTAALVRSLIPASIMPRWASNLVSSLDIFRGPQGAPGLTTEKSVVLHHSRPLPIALSTVPPSSSSSNLGAQIFQQCSKACVTVLVRFDSRWGSSTFFSGSGFFVSADGLVVTAAHVVLGDPAQYGRPIRANAVFVTVQDYNGSGTTRSIEAKILGTAGQADIALLHVPGVSGQQFIQVADNEAKAGDPCWIIGNPLGEDALSIAAGTIRDPTFFDPTGMQYPESLLTDLQAYPGNSGSVILNQAGRFIGIFTFGITDATGLGGGVNSRTAWPILTQLSASFRGQASDKVNQAGDYISGWSGAFFNGFSSANQQELGSTSTLIQGAQVVAFFDRTIWPDVQLNDIILSMAVGGLVTQLGIFPGETAPSSVLLQNKPGTQVSLQIIRGPNWDRPFTVSQTLGPVPERLNYPLIPDPGLFKWPGSAKKQCRPIGPQRKMRR